MSDQEKPSKSDSVSHLAHRLRKALHEAAALLLALLGLMLGLALFSFNANDPGWNMTSQQAATNLMGLSGAWLADVLFSLAGAAAWLLPLSILHLAIQLLRRPWLQEEWDPFIPSLRFSGLMLLLVGVAGIAALHFYDEEVSWVYGAGGILGESLASLAAPMLGHLGATLVFLSACFAGFSLITGWSWLMIMDELGHLLVDLGEKARNALLQAEQLRRQEKQDYYREEAESNQADSPGWLEGIKNKLPQIPQSSKTVNRELYEPRLEPDEPRDDSDEVEEEPRLLTAQDLQPAKNHLPQTPVGEKPGLQLLDATQPQEAGFTQQELESLAVLLQQRLIEFGVKAEVVDAHPGPVITRFELELAAGVKSSKVANLALDLARALKVPSVRVVEVISGKSTIGIELPNAKRALIRLTEVLDHEAFTQDKHPLPLALG
ncbi:DNA translocase FtsK 4TM domain-containing protein, partial [Marinospirillum sp.]|uniref:DNA translocase FtsK n=1 Tax=Marinospirillum sp. TaxID=2183934 RepID=UPI0028701671